MNIKTIIFDLGGVLIDWNPEYLYLDIFEGDRVKMNAFFEQVCTMDWNENQDAGYPLSKATEDRIALFPEYETLIKIYYGRWEEMLGEAITGSVQILKKLINDPKFRVVALTNWSAESFPVAIKRYPFLQHFEGILVSGEEKMRKPFTEIYELMLERYKLKAATSVFIDDNLDNVVGARKVGMKAIHYKNSQQLTNELKYLGVKL